MTYSILVSEQVKQFLQALPEKSKRVCRNNLQKLQEPYPGEGIGDKEKLNISGQEIYRLHISRTFTVFYVINTKKNRKSN